MNRARLVYRTKIADESFSVRQGKWPELFSYIPNGEIQLKFDDTVALMRNGTYNLSVYAQQRQFSTNFLSVESFHRVHIVVDDDHQRRFPLDNSRKKKN